MARILEWVAMPCSRGSSQPRDWTHVSHIAGGFFTSWAAKEAHCLEFHCGSLVVLVQSLSRVHLFETPWTAAHLASLFLTISQSLLKLMSIKSVMPSNYFILRCPLLLRPSIFSSFRVFSSELALCIRWPKFWSFSFSISPSNEYSGLISFRMDWFDLAMQGTLKSLLQHHNSKTSIFWHSAFFMIQLSCPYRTTGKTIAFQGASVF